MRIRSRLDAVKHAGRLLEVLRLSDDLAAEVAQDGGAHHVRLLVKAIRVEDQITAIAAIHALARVPHETADTTLAELLSDGRGFVREHAAWALGSRAPRVGVIARLTGLVVMGGFTGMLAQRTLEEWAAAAPDIVAVGLESALIGITNSSQRYRLVETLGLIQQTTVTGLLQSIALNTAEDLMVRVAAVAALGDRGAHPATRDVLERLAQGASVRLAEVAQLALVDLSVSAQPRQGLAHSRHSTPTTAECERKRGLTVAQLFLHADIDPELSHAGSGDNGGIATLLVRLGDALVGAHDRLGDEISVDGVHALPVTRVLTLSRGAVREALLSLESLGDRHLGHLYARVPLLQGDVQSANAWPLRIAARRGIARIIRSAGTVDVVHLRMADVGSLAALEVARAHNIPVVFTSAPDPHGLIHSMDLSGALTRENFGTVDEREHFWFRARLLQRLVASSTHTVYFPRPNLRLDMRELMGIDIANAPGKHTTVPEGIDLSVSDEAVSEASDLASGGEPSEALRDLRALCDGLPSERRGLPLLVSVGRFHRVKGTATVVEAWAGSELRQRSNLLLIGGNLQHPSSEEQEQLDKIQRIIGRDQQLSHGLMLSGNRPHRVVSRWIAAARFGMPGYVAPNGVYVCGSLKEEFGLAVLEAMAAGLLVVAPDGGGPATYVEHGRTGFLTTTWNPATLGDAIRDALDCAAAEQSDERARHSRRVVQERFTVEAMAEALSGVYSGAHYDDLTLQRELDAVS